ncbi:MAG: glycoside hydrolase family 140 protein [Kiritimatiellae bacterium]|nr:glycoside hydrolase family 140 protein [Kiritimatiellia bacterium]
MSTCELATGQLKVSANGRYLVDEAGKPFFYLADTGWEVFHDTVREDVDLYLEDRAAKGFTVIQALLMHEPDGLNTPNRYGDFTLVDNDPTRPNPAYFEHVDYVVRKADSLGLRMTIAPAWARGHIEFQGGPSRLFDEQSARAYGQFLGERYRDFPIMWVMAGDIIMDGTETIWPAMARALKESSGGRHLITLHGTSRDSAKRGSSPLFHNADWLDLNMTYSGHFWDAPTYAQVARDYARTPAKPTFDGEPKYENHPLIGDGSGYHSHKKLWDGVTRANAHQMRQAAYWAMLAGAAGHTYGCNEVWQFYDPTRPCSDYAYPNIPWQNALHLPGAAQMGLMRKLFESRPWHTLVPDLTVIAGGQGEGEDHVQAARGEDGGFLFVYLPTGKSVTIDMAKLSGSTVRAHWFDPRTGQWTAIGPYTHRGQQAFTPPKSHRIWDWVLVLDDAARGFPADDFSPVPARNGQ